MLANLLKGASAAKLPVEYLTSTFIPNQTSDSVLSLTLSSGFSVGDMLVAMTANRTTTSPGLLPGYTTIAARSSTGSRSSRLQYKIATSTSETITWTGAYGYLLVLRNASAATGVWTDAASGSSVLLPNISGLDTSGNGMIIAGSYIVGYTSVDSPYSLLTSGGTAIAAYIPNNTNEILSSKYISYGSTFGGSYLAQFLP